MAPPDRRAHRLSDTEGVGCDSSEEGGKPGTASSWAPVPHSLAHREGAAEGSRAPTLQAPHPDSGICTLPLRQGWRESPQSPPSTALIAHLLPYREVPFRGGPLSLALSNPSAVSCLTLLCRAAASPLGRSQPRSRAGLLPRGLESQVWLKVRRDLGGTCCGYGCRGNQGPDADSPSSPCTDSAWSWVGSRSYLVGRESFLHCPCVRLPAPSLSSLSQPKTTILPSSAPVPVLLPP